MAGKLLCALLFGFFYLVLGKVPHSTQIHLRLRISTLPRNDDPLRISLGCTHIALLLPCLAFLNSRCHLFDRHRLLLAFHCCHGSTDSPLPLPDHARSRCDYGDHGDRAPALSPIYPNLSRPQPAPSQPLSQPHPNRFTHLSQSIPNAFALAFSITRSPDHRITRFRSPPACYAEGRNP